MEWIIPLAKESPWFGFVLLMFWAVVKAGKWCGSKLFDEEKGVITSLVTRHNEFLDQTAKTGERVAVALVAHSDQIRSLERRIEGAWSARHSDPVVWDLLFLSNPIPMAMVARDGTYLQVNQALCLLTGWTSVELKARRWQDITPPDEMPNDSANADELVAGTSDTYRLKKHLMKKDGGKVTVLLHAFRYPRMGQFRHFFSFYIPE